MLKQAAPDAAADPVLARLIAEGGSRPWSNWPLLLALTLWSPMWASAAYSPNHAALVNNMDYLAVVVPDLAFAATVADAHRVRSWATKKSALQPCACRQTWHYHVTISAVYSDRTSRCSRLLAKKYSDRELLQHKG